MTTFQQAVVAELASLRSSKGMSQTAFASELQINQSVISKVESGNRALSLEEAFEWAETLGLTPSETASLLRDKWTEYGARGKSYWHK